MKLNKYLRDNGIKKMFFAKSLGIHFCTLTRILNTNETSKTISLAIELLTHGNVSRDDFTIIEKKAAPILAKGVKQKIGADPLTKE